MCVCMCIECAQTRVQSCIIELTVCALCCSGVETMLRAEECEQIWLLDIVPPIEAGSMQMASSAPNESAACRG